MGLGTAFIPPDSEICVDQMKFRNDHTYLPGLVFYELNCLRKADQGSTPLMFLAWKNWYYFKKALLRRVNTHPFKSQSYDKTGNSTRWF